MWGNDGAGPPTPQPRCLPRRTPPRPALHRRLPLSGRRQSLDVLGRKYTRREAHETRNREFKDICRNLSNSPKTIGTARLPNCVPVNPGVQPLNLETLPSSQPGPAREPRDYHGPQHSVPVCIHQICRAAQVENGMFDDLEAPGAATGAHERCTPRRHSMYLTARRHPQPERPETPRNRKMRRCAVCHLLQHRAAAPIPGILRIRPFASVSAITELHKVHGMAPAVISLMCHRRKGQQMGSDRP